MIAPVAEKTYPTTLSDVALIALADRARLEIAWLAQHERDAQVRLTHAVRIGREHFAAFFPREDVQSPLWHAFIRLVIGAHDYTLTSIAQQARVAITARRAAGEAVAR